MFPFACSVCVSVHCATFLSPCNYTVYCYEHIVCIDSALFGALLDNLSVCIVYVYLLYFASIHYDDVIMTMLESQITSLTVVYSIVYSGVHQRKHQSSASLAFVREIHRGQVNFPHKWPVTRKMFPFDDVIMNSILFYSILSYPILSYSILSYPILSYSTLLSLASKPNPSSGSRRPISRCPLVRNILWSRNRQSGCNKSLYSFEIEQLVKY